MGTRKIIKEFVIARDNAIIECWEKNSTKPIEDFVESCDLYDPAMKNNFLKTDWRVKWLTLIKMTYACTSKEVMKYHSQAAQKEIEIREEINS